MRIITSFLQLYESVITSEFLFPCIGVWVVGVITSAFVARALQKVSIVVDNSNIFIGLQNTGKVIFKLCKWRLDYKKLLIFLRRPFFYSSFRFSSQGGGIEKDEKGSILAFATQSFSYPRALANAYIVVSIPPEEETLWDKCEEAGFELFKKEKVVEVATGRVVERGVDERLQSIILDIALKYSNRGFLRRFLDPFGLFPDILVIGTGDGNNDSKAQSFPNIVRKALAIGMRVEVAAWKNGISGQYKKIEQETNGRRFKVRILDDNIADFSFQQTFQQKPTIVRQ